MGIISVTSLHGSPGVTTLALGIVGKLTRLGRSAVYLEADPTGGVVAARFDRPLLPNLTSLAGAARHGLSVAPVEAHLQYVLDGVRGILAHPAGTQTTAALNVASGTLADTLRGDDGVAVVDLGRWFHEHPATPLCAASEQVIVVLRPVLEQVVLLLNAVDTWPIRERIALVTVGHRLYSARQIAAATGFEVLAQLPNPTVDDASSPTRHGRRRRASWASAVEQLGARIATGSGNERSGTSVLESA
mgnify:CR=1 FL=1